MDGKIIDDIFFNCSISNKLFSYLEKGSVKSNPNLMPSSTNSHLQSQANLESNFENSSGFNSFDDDSMYHNMSIMYEQPLAVSPSLLRSYRSGSGPPSRTSSFSSNNSISSRLSQITSNGDMSPNLTMNSAAANGFGHGNEQRMYNDLGQMAVPTAPGMIMYSLPAYPPMNQPQMVMITPMLPMPMIYTSVSPRHLQGRNTPEPLLVYSQPPPPPLPPQGYPTPNQTAEGYYTYTHPMQPNTFYYPTQYPPR